VSNGSSGPIPVFRLDPEEIPKRLRFEAWREIIRPIVDVTRLAHERRFELQYEAYKAIQGCQDGSAPYHSASAKGA